MNLPPNRGDYLRYAVLNQLQNYEQGLNLSSICTQLKLSGGPKVISQTEKYLKTWIDEGVIVEDSNTYRLNDRYKMTWNRTKNLVNSLGNQIFNAQEDPFLVSINGEQSGLRH